MKPAPRSTPRRKRRFNSIEEELPAAHAVAPALLGALKKARKAIDSLMPGIGSLAIGADDLANINEACLEGDRAIADAAAAGVGVDQ